MGWLFMPFYAVFQFLDWRALGLTAATVPRPVSGIARPARWTESPRNRFILTCPWRPDAELSRGIERVHYKTQSTYQVLQKRYVAAQSGVNGVPIWEAAGYLGMSVLRNHRRFPI